MKKEKTPHLATLTVPADRPRRAARHGKIARVSEDVYTVRGRMPSAPGRPLFERLFMYYSRTMTIVRSQNEQGEFELTLFNTLRLNEQGLKALSALGQVKHVVRLGSYHGVDDAFYLDFYDAEYWIVDGMTSAEGLRTKPNRLTNDAPDGLPIPGSQVFFFDALAYPEAIYLLPANAHRAGVAITTDSIQNHTAIVDLDNSPLVSIAIWRIGLAGEARLGPIWMRDQMPRINKSVDANSRADKKRNAIGAFFRPQFERLLAEHEFDMRIPGHGWPIYRGAKLAIQKSIEAQLG